MLSERERPGVLPALLRRNLPLPISIPTVNDWRAVVVYARRSLEPDEPVPYQLLLASQQVQRVYLDELREAAEHSLGIGIMQLVVESEQRATNRAKQLISQTRQQLADTLTQRQIIELIETIMVYKFPSLSRQEVENMLGLDVFRQTKVYQEAKQEGKLEAVPRLLKLGLSLEQVAEALELEIEVVRQAAPKQP